MDIPCFLLLLMAGCLPQSTEVLPTEEVTPTATKSAIPRPTSTKRPSCIDQAVFGDPVESSYVLPYPIGKQSTIDQSYCQAFGSHSEQLAYDFAMAFGDEVVAARSGQVIEIVESYSDDDTNPSRFNYVFILHEDRTVAFYAHLMQNGVAVEINDIVEAGQVIAYVGHSGMPADYRSVPHFGVYASWPPVEGKDIPVNFRNTSGKMDPRKGLTPGSSYEALPWDP